MATQATWFLYNALFAVGYTLLLPRFLYRMWRRGGYRRHFMQRFARYDAETLARLGARRRTWVHAVSVGEIFVALTFMRALRARRPDLAFVVTTTTSTGYAMARGQMGPDDVLLYFPLDFPGIVRRALDRLQPEALLLTECELWPNLVRLSHARGIPVVLINARMSEKSFRGYSLVRPFVSPVLNVVDLVLAQGRADGERLVALGARADRTHVVGSSKYDMTDATVGMRPYVADLLRAAGAGPDDPILLGGSTWAGEEAILLRAYRTLKARHPGLLLVLVPRHAERTRQVVAELRRGGFQWVQRSRLSGDSAPADPRPDVLLVDTTGELRDFYALASVIFVGKSLTQRGGQNVIEPAALGKPVVVGPNMQNFLPVMDDLRAADAIVQVQDEAGLTAALEALMDDPARRGELGRRAAEAVRAHRGAVDQSVALILRAVSA
jgi:3-deoxy-D-manno-octulosonic-acid transferase